MYKLAPSTELVPGTGLVQFYPRGMGEYVGTPTYFSTPAGQAGIRGLGCVTPCGCGQCGVGGWGDGGGLFDTGLFSGGLDPSTWGPGELAVVAIGAYMVFSTFFTTGQAASYARSVPGRARRHVGKKVGEAISGTGRRKAKRK